MAGSDEVSATFAYGAQSAAAARRLVSETLRAWDRSDLDEIATLLVSELIANVVLHAGTGLDLYLRRSGDRVRIEVHDGSQRLPARKHHSMTATTGRGLLLVQELSRQWGAEPTASGKAVWFELSDAPPSVSPDPGVGAQVDLGDWDDLIEEPSAPAVLALGHERGGATPPAHARASGRHRRQATRLLRRPDQGREVR